MKNYINIDSWYGLFGNNLMQLAGAIFYAKCYKESTVIRSPKNNFFKINPEIVIENEFNFEVKSISSLTWKTHNYYNSILDYVDLENYKKFLKKNIISVYRNEIYNLLDKSFNFNQFSGLDLKDTLSIHFRSGDATTTNPHPAYVQSPWSYFKKIIEKVQPKKVILCTGFGYHNSNLNPCYDKIINYCIDRGISVDYRIKSLPEDVYILSHSEKVVVGGVSTFSLTSSYVNKNCSDIYYPSFFNSGDEFKLFNPSVNLHLFEFDDYYKMGEWKYDPKTMIEYPEEKITEVYK